ncbi:MAG: lasso RiPP family leader peptide-containing protein [Gemmatimonadales bacterium]
MKSALDWRRGKLHGFPPGEESMYEKPVLQRFGTFRELTTQGVPCTDKDFGSSDGLTLRGVDITCAS